MDTFELLPSLAQGELRETSAAELVAAVFRSRASGTLSIETKGTGEVRAFFRAGEMCGTASFPGFHTLAHVLLAHDYVGALDIDRTRDESAQSRKRHGEVLVEKGLLTPEQLHEALATQCRENLGILLGLAEGTYEWRGSEPPPAWTRDMFIEPVSAIFQALTEPHLEARRGRVLEWLGERRARLSVDWSELRDRVVLGVAERKAVALLEEPRTASEFVRTSRLPATRAEALLAALLLAGGAEPGDEPAAVSVESAAEAPLELETAADSLPAPQGADELQTPFEKSLRGGVPAGSERILEVPPEEDEPLELAEPDPRTEERSREVRRRLLQRGLRNLGGRPFEAESAEPEPHVPHAVPSADPIDPKTRALIEEVRERAASIEEQDAYARLGIERNSSTDHIKQAYLTAAKRYHPDRAGSQPELQVVQRELQRVFGALTEAHELIASSAARTEYDRALRGEGRPPSRKDEAAMALKMGDVLLKKRDYEGAVAKLRRAADLDANGDVLSALAWALMADPKQSASGKEEAMSLINRALRASGATARTYYVAGVLWRTKDPAAAADAFRKALELDPRHSDASLELRLLETRQGKASAPKSGTGGLSGLLFGKRKP